MNSGSSHSKPPLRLEETTFSESRLFNTCSAHRENVCFGHYKEKMYGVVSIKKQKNPKPNLMQSVNLNNFSSILQSFIK